MKRKLAAVIVACVAMITLVGCGSGAGGAITPKYYLSEIGDILCFETGSYTLSCDFDTVTQSYTYTNEDSPRLASTWIKLSGAKILCLYVDNSQDVHSCNWDEVKLNEGEKKPTWLKQW